MLQHPQAVAASVTTSYAHVKLCMFLLLLCDRHSALKLQAHPASFSGGWLPSGMSLGNSLSGLGPFCHVSCRHALPETLQNELILTSQVHAVHIACVHGPAACSDAPQIRFMQSGCTFI